MILMIENPDPTWAAQSRASWKMKDNYLQIVTERTDPVPPVGTEVCCGFNQNGLPTVFKVFKVVWEISIHDGCTWPHAYVRRYIGP